MSGVGDGERGVFEYVAGLPEEVVQVLYCNQWACQAVFRSLPPLAQHYLLRLLWPGAHPEQAVRRWVEQHGAHAHTTALNRLLELRLCYRETPADSKQASYFQRCLLHKEASSDQNQSLIPTSATKGHLPSVSEATKLTP